MEEYLDSLNSFEEIFDQIELVPTKNMSKKQKNDFIRLSASSIQR